MAPTLAANKLVIDLRNTTYADGSGIQVLREIYAAAGARLIAGTPWTEYLAEEIMRDVESSTEEEQ